jgi:hypothetical protein
MPVGTPVGKDLENSVEVSVEASADAEVDVVGSGKEFSPKGMWQALRRQDDLFLLPRLPLDVLTSYQFPG